MSSVDVEACDCVVIGAGVVGLAVARSLVQAGREVFVLESGSGIGSKTSSRNSEVIHAGIYYPKGSLKGSLCMRGKQLLYQYCQERHIPHKRTGKLIVATSEKQLDELGAIRERARLNGVTDLMMLSAEQVRAVEPALRCVGALLSPSTGIIDSHAFMLSLLGDIESAGGLLALRARVVSMEPTSQGLIVSAEDGTQLKANWVINAAGLNAPEVAATCAALDSQYVPKAYFAKGSYFSLAGRAPFSHLIYPVPEAAGLGVHLTLDMGGHAKFGPDVQWVDSEDDLQVETARSESFYAEIRKYWPDLPDQSLLPAYAGIRPKISGPGQVAADFCIQGPNTHGVSGLVNLFGIESPGLTSSLAIAEYVRGIVLPQ